MKHVDQSGEDVYFESESTYSSECSSSNDISDQAKTGEEVPHGYSPSSQFIHTKSLPDLLLINSPERSVDESRSELEETAVAHMVDATTSLVGGKMRSHLGRRVSLDSQGYLGNIRKESLQHSLTPADSKASTLVPVSYIYIFIM